MGRNVGLSSSRYGGDEQPVEEERARRRRTGRRIRARLCSYIPDFVAIIVVASAVTVAVILLTSAADCAKEASYNS